MDRTSASAHMNRGRERLTVLIEEALAKAAPDAPPDFAGLARSLELPLSEIFGVASFYAFLGTRPRGRHTIRVCRSLPCRLAEAVTLRQRLEKMLGIGAGQTTRDGRFTLEVVGCIGACDQAPAMLVDHDLHGRLTAGKITKILKSYL
jgi:NADH-quinone oxidoreductase subunit E